MTKPGETPEEQKDQAQPEEELMAFDKRRQMKDKPKKQGGFGQRKAPIKTAPKKEEATETKEAPAEEAPPAGTFFKVKKPEKKSSFGSKKR